MDIYGNFSLSIIIELFDIIKDESFEFEKENFEMYKKILFPDVEKYREIL